METDYQNLTQADFELVVKNYAMFRTFGLQADEGGSEEGDGAEAQ